MTDTQQQPGKTDPLESGLPSVEAGLRYVTTSLNDDVQCRVCGRHLLLGERSTGLFDSMSNGPYDVCDHCLPTAHLHGMASKSAQAASNGESPTSMLGRLFGRLRTRVGSRQTMTVGDAAIPAAVSRFNNSRHVRSLAGLRRTLGPPTAAASSRSASEADVVLTVAWDIVWYRYNIGTDEIVVERGTHTGDLDLDSMYASCSVARSGKVTVDAPGELCRAQAADNAGISGIGNSRRTDEVELT